jgi:hypothetical protein
MVPIVAYAGWIWHWAISWALLLVTARDNWRLAFLVVATAICIVFAIWNLKLAAYPPGDAPCTLAPEPANHGTIDRGWYLLAVGLALLGGRAIGRGGARTQRRPGALLTTPAGISLKSDTDLRDVARIQPTTTNPMSKVAGALAVQVLIVLFVSVALAALLYETIGVAASNDPWPLTFMVRCLNEGSRSHVTSGSTLALTTAIAFLIGSWFWPERSGRGAPGI